MPQTVAQSQRATETNAEIDVQLCNVFKVFDGETAVRGVNLNIQKGEFFSILGPSGCGKTTTLRLIAGFETPSSGDLYIRGQSMSYVPPYRRPVNTVFQNYALFNHMTVWDNVAFGLRIKKCSRTQVRQRVAEVLQLVKMDDYAQRFPAQLSGGQQQRVALARALVNRPAVVLLDEPLGALDLKLRKEMQVELSNLHQTLGVTFVMVTHDQEEALSLSDRIAVMRGGLIEQIGTPSQIYEHPSTPFVADFIGDTNLFQGYVEASDHADMQVTTQNGLKIRVKPSECWTGDTNSPVVVSVRPEKIQVSLDLPTADSNCFEGRLKHVMYLGTHVHYLIELMSGDCLTVLQPNRLESLPEPHTPIHVYWSATDCLALTM
ncbi:MAG: ABC transporter ATP-binding protein [Leptolyngbya sp. DLM2.Bin15]|nr:MAG: ABC transporter ATP-binding protein [Leptolyngbya sp. DLM2.Bin15]